MSKDIQKVNAVSENIEKENLLKLKNIFPLAFDEDKIDIEKLKNLYTENIVDEKTIEKYSLSWAGKSNAFKAIRTPSTGTLVKDNKGVNENNTENVFIEGDNLEVLKLLQKHYFNKIKMIYIDPPYNTGKDFVYKDNFTEDVESYYEKTGQAENGIKMTANTEKNGRFHSDWLTMMYPRLFLARNLLKDDGVIFVSIDDNEVANLRLIMDEIFGEENFVGSFIWYKKLTGGYDNININTQHEYVLVYAKVLENLNLNGETKESLYKLVDENGKKYKWDSLWNVGGLTYSKSLDYAITAPNGSEIWPPGERGVSFWLWSKDKVEKEKDKLKFEKDKNGKWKVYKKVYASDEIVVGSMLDKEIVKGNTFSSSEMKNYFEGLKVFDYAKPTPLIKYLIQRGTNKKDDIILDFFAGSGTTAHAVMDLNAEDGGNRKWICVQLPEVTDEKSEAYKAGYKTISEISRERIRRAAKKIDQELEEYKSTMLGVKVLGIGKEKEVGIVHDRDTGFKSFYLSKSNYRKWNVLTDENSTEDVYIITEEVEEVERKIFVSFTKKVSQKDVEKLKLTDNDMFVCFDSALDDTTKVNIAREVNLKVM